MSDRTVTTAKPVMAAKSLTRTGGPSSQRSRSVSKGRLDLGAIARVVPWV